MDISRWRDVWSTLQSVSYSANNTFTAIKAINCAHVCEKKVQAATYFADPAVVGSLSPPSAQNCGNIPFQGKWLWQFKEETKRGPTSKSAHRGERVRRVERREKRGD